ncbi:hypothetical protein JMUB7524_27340 [Staphylococcus aureus]
MIRRPPRSTPLYSSAASDVYKRQDKILVDAPCSGLGVMRHKPEIKYTQSKQHIESLVELQLEILENVKNLSLIHI